MTLGLGETVQQFLRKYPPARTSDEELRAARFDAGLAFPHFDSGCGGLGLGPQAPAEVEQLFLAAGAADWSERNVIGLGMAAPAIHEHGTPDQRLLLRPLFIGRQIWCQLFSEPDSGSDLASVRTMAVRDGDEWVVRGQKVWTTLAHIARFGLLLARSDRSASRHAGLTCFILDMRATGVRVAPLRQITGEAEFNEVYLDDVRVPDHYRLGPEGGGWSVARTILMNERKALPRYPASAGDGPIAEAVRLYRDRGSKHRDRLLRVWVAAEVARLTNMRNVELLRHGTPGPEGSLAKLQMAETSKAVHELIVDLMGVEGTLIDHYRFERPQLASLHGGGDLRKAFLRTRANSIEGGTSEILRDIVAERVLGLPREPGR